MKQLQSLRVVRYAAWAGLALALLCAATQCIWKAQFARGRVPGIYWLFIALDRVVPWLAGLLALGFAAMLAVWIVRAFQERPRPGQVAITAGILLVACLASLFTIPANRLESGFWTTADGSPTPDATYYLVAAEGILGTSYGLVGCDQLGLVCRYLHSFGAPGWYLPYRLPNPSLEYARATDTLLVRVGEEIYTYQAGRPGGIRPVSTPRSAALGDLCGMAWSPDGRWLASGWANGLILWNVETGERLRTLENDLYVTGLAWSPDGTRVAATLDPVFKQPIDSRMIGIWDAATGKKVRTLGGPGELVVGVAWSPDGTHLVSHAPLSSTLILWDVETGQKLRTWPADYDSAAFLWSSDGTLLVASYKAGALILWEVESGRQLRTFPVWSSGHTEWSPDGTRLGFYRWGYYNGHNYPEGTATVWDLESGAELHVLKAQHIMAGAFSWSADRIRLATSGDGTILWDVETGEQLRTLDVPSYMSSWSPDGTRLVTGTKGGPVILWDVETGKRLGTLSRD